MKKLICAICVICGLTSLALPQSGDTVVIDDISFVVVSQSEWADLTNKVATCCDTWAKLNATESGRVALHGSRGHTTVTNGQITVEYADGFTRTEDVPKRQSATRSAKPETRNQKPGTRNPKRETRNLPAKLAEIMARREKLKDAGPLVVTVEEIGGAK